MTTSTINTNELAFVLVSVFVVIPAMIGWLIYEVKDLIRLTKMSKHDQYREIMLDDYGIWIDE